jgi:hypothetical protein
MMAVQEQARHKTAGARASAADAKAKAAAQEEAKQARRRVWLERVDKELAAADAVEPQRDPESLAKQLDAMAESANEAEVLEPADKSGIRDRVRLAKRGLYERHVNHLLDCAMAAARDRNREQERNEILKDLTGKFTIAMRLGSPEELRESVKYRLTIIRETSAAGISAKAKENAEREASRKEAAFSNERRTFARWSDPPLTVVIAGRAYTTTNWSLGGALIEGVETAGRRGGEIEIRIGLDRGRLYNERVEVVRYSPDDKVLAVRIRRFGSVLLQVKRDCDGEGLEPA